MNLTRTVHVNGEEHTLAGAEPTLLDLVGAVTGHELAPDGSRDDGGRLGFAAAVGGEVVPRTSWSARVLDQGDEVEIVTAVQGG